MVDIVCLYISIQIISFMSISSSAKVQMLKQSTISYKRSCANTSKNILVAALVPIFIISLMLFDLSSMLKLSRNKVFPVSFFVILSI